MNYYEILGVAKDASPADIKAAYRKLAQQHHPDKGGDKERFQQIQSAYEVLSDDEKRAEYDATGTVRTKGPTLRQEAMEVVSAVIDEVLEGFDPEHDNIIEKACKIISGGIQKLEAQQKDLTAKREKVLKAMGRTRAKEGKEDAVSPVLVHLEQQFARPLEGAKRSIAKCQEALKILREHDYTVDARPDSNQGGRFGNIHPNDLHNAMQGAGPFAKFF